MGLIEFFIVVLVCCALAFGTSWAATKLFGAPSWVPQVIWGVACLIILVTLAKALGLWGFDPKIPSLK